MPGATTAEIAVKTLSTAPGELEEVFRTHHTRMLRAAHRITGNLQDAEDVLQTVFLRLLHRGRPIVLTADAGSYLQRAAVNAALDLVRTRRQRAVVALEDATHEPAGEPAWRPDGRVGDDELRQWLRAQLGKLSPMAAEIFVLRYFEGFANGEIAAMLGTSPNSVGVILHRTRRRLRDELGSLAGQQDQGAAGGEGR